MTIPSIRMMICLYLSLLIAPHLTDSFRISPTGRLNCKYSPKRSFDARINSLISRDNHKLRLVPQFLQLQAENQWGLYAVIASSAAAALKLERNTAVGRSLSGPVTAMLLSAILTNLGVLPPAGSIHLTNLQFFVLKLATPLLLFRADLRKIFRETGVMLQAFFLGTVGTLLGSFLAMFLLSGPLNSIGLPGDSWKIASALTAKNIGGGLNFFAVADAVQVSPAALATGLAVDNLLGLLYFPLISWIGAPYDQNKENEMQSSDMRGLNSGRESAFSSAGDLQTASSSSSGDSRSCSQYTPILLDSSHSKEEESSIDVSTSASTVSTVNFAGNDIESTVITGSVDQVENMTEALAVGLCIASVGDYLAHLSSLPSIAVSTFLAVVLATIIPRRLEGIASSGELLGKLFLLFFFASIGNASGTVSSTFAAKGAASLVMFECILYAVHLSVVLGVGGKILKLPMPDLLLASNANIGNAATASSLATAKGWKSRILPAILVGTLGNAFGTFAGLSLGSFVLRGIAGY